MPTPCAAGSRRRRPLPSPAVPRRSPALEVCGRTDPSLKKLQAFSHVILLMSPSSAPAAVSSARTCSGASGQKQSECVVALPRDDVDADPCDAAGSSSERGTNAGEDEAASERPSRIQFRPPRSLSCARCPTYSLSSGSRLASRRVILGANRLNMMRRTGSRRRSASRWAVERRCPAGPCRTLTTPPGGLLMAIESIFATRCSRTNVASGPGHAP